MEKYYYSYDEENFIFDNPGEAAEALWNAGNFEVGDIDEIYQGEPEERKASFYVPRIAEMMIDDAWDNCGEAAENWNIDSEQNSKSLQEYIGKAIDEWCDKNDMQPNFFMIKNVKSVKIKFVDEDGGCEIIEE